MQTAIPCLFMRGGTSRGPFFLGADLPGDVALRDRVLLAAMGSPDPRQIDGVGGTHPLTSKVATIDHVLPQWYCKRNGIRANTWTNRAPPGASQRAIRPSSTA